MSKPKKYRPGVGYKIAMEEATKQIEPGSLYFTEVYHDLWCDGGSGERCTCKPDIVLRPMLKPKDN